MFEMDSVVGLDFFQEKTIKNQKEESAMKGP